MYKLLVHIVLGLCPRACHRWYSRNISFVLSECYRNTCIKLLKYFSNNTTRICYVKHLICFLDVNCLLHLVLTSSSLFFVDWFIYSQSRSKGIKTEWLFTILMQKLKKKTILSGCLSYPNSSTNLFLFYQWSNLFIKFFNFPAIF